MKDEDIPQRMVLSKSSKEILKRLAFSDFVSYNQLKILDLLTLNFHSFFRRTVADEFFLDNAGDKENASIEDFEIENPDGLYKLKVREYCVSQAKGCEEIVLFAHGGGWVQGNIDTHDALCRKISTLLRKRVFSVDYRLSPEYRFPMPLSDLLSVYIWCAKSLCKDIILIGDDAGASLCATLCVKLNAMRYRQLPVAQILFYPILSSNTNGESYDLFGSGYGFTKEWIKYFIYQYTGAEYNDPILSNNKFIYPLKENNLAVFPKTLLVSASCDVLLDDQLKFCDKLKAAGVFAEQIIIPGSIHGFMAYGKYFSNEIDYVLRETNKFLLS